MSDFRVIKAVTVLNQNTSEKTEFHLWEDNLDFHLKEQYLVALILQFHFGYIESSYGAPPRTQRVGEYVWQHYHIEIKQTPVYYGIG